MLLGATGLAAVAAVSGHASEREAALGTTMVANIDLIGTFEVLAYSWGVSNSGSVHSGGGGGTGKANVQDLSFTKYTDSSSPKLFSACVTGRHLVRATLIVTSRRGQPAIEYRLDEVLVSSFSIGGSETEQRPTENVTLNFGKVQLTIDGNTAQYNILTAI